MEKENNLSCTQKINPNINKINKIYDEILLKKNKTKININTISSEFNSPLMHTEDNNNQIHFFQEEKEEKYNSNNPFSDNEKSNLLKNVKKIEKDLFKINDFKKLKGKSIDNKTRNKKIINNNSNSNYNNLLNFTNAINFSEIMNTNKLNNNFTRNNQKENSSSENFEYLSN